MCVLPQFFIPVHLDPMGSLVLTLMVLTLLELSRNPHMETARMALAPSFDWQYVATTTPSLWTGDSHGMFADLLKCFDICRRINHINNIKSYLITLALIF